MAREFVQRCWRNRRRYFFCTSNTGANCGTLTGTDVAAGAQGGKAGTGSGAGALGGAAASGKCTGSGCLKQSGGAGGAPTALSGGAGGGGAGGPNGDGKAGGASAGTGSAAGGGGNGGGSVGNTQASSTVGGAGGNNSSSAGSGAGGTSANYDQPVRLAVAVVALAERRLAAARVALEQTLIPAKLWRWRRRFWLRLEWDGAIWCRWRIRRRGGGTGGFNNSNGSVRGSAIIITYTPPGSPSQIGAILVGP